MLITGQSDDYIQQINPALICLDRIPDCVLYPTSSYLGSRLEKIFADACPKIWLEQSLPFIGLDEVAQRALDSFGVCSFEKEPGVRVGVEIDKEVAVYFSGSFWYSELVYSHGRLWYPESNI